MNINDRAEKIAGMRQMLDELRAIGDAIGVAPDCPYGRHVRVTGPTFRGGVSFDAIVCDAEDLFKEQETER